MSDLLSLLGNESPIPQEEKHLFPLLQAFPPLSSVEVVRERAVEQLVALDPALAEQIPDALPFPPEDDPFTKTEQEWEELWYSQRESAVRVYLNARMEFRRQLARAVNGEPNDLKPWTYWAFHSPRPSDGEPVYGLTPERTEELGWSYPGPSTDFRIYREAGSIEAQI